jgi:hypothetical protein
VVVQTFQHAGPGAQLDISVQSKNESTWRILIDGFSLKDDGAFPDDRVMRMASSIGVSIHFDRSSRRLAIEVPVSIGFAQGNGAAG